MAPKTKQKAWVGYQPMSTDSQLFAQPNTMASLDGLGGSAVSQVAQSVAPTTVMQQSANDTYNWGGMTDKDLAGSTVPNNGNASGTQPVSYLGAAWKGTKDFLGITPDAPKQTYQDYLSKNGGAFDTAKGMQTEAQFNENQLKQGYLDNQQFANYAGAGMGAVQTGLGVLNYFDQKAMNKKNSQLIDQQIVNNQDIMGTRKARAADITKYFG